jgi:glycyl-tRNA synthetase beta subunit
MSKAAQGFVRGQGVTTEDIVFKELNGVEYVYVTKFTNKAIFFAGPFTSSSTSACFSGIAVTFTAKRRGVAKAEGNWSKAAQGFVRGQGVTTEDIVFKELNGVEYVFFAGPFTSSSTSACFSGIAVTFTAKRRGVAKDCTVDLLLEIGLEEMPAHVVTPSRIQLEEKVIKFLDEHHLDYETVQSFATPRFHG